MADQPLAAQFLAAGGVVGFFSVVSLVLLISQIDSQTNASRGLSQAQAVVARLNTLGRDYGRQETAFLEYLRTRDNRFLASVHEGRQSWNEGLKAVEASVDPEALAKLGESYSHWVASTTQLINQVSPHRDTPGIVSGVDAGELKSESELFKETSALVDRLIHAETRQLTIRSEQEKAATQLTFTAIALINIVLLIVFGIALAKLYLSIVRPLTLLAGEIRRFQSGDFKARVEVSNESQIGYLQGSFNEMAGKIETMVEDLRKLDHLKSEFIATVSHELRTPLTSIGGFAQLIASGDAGPVSETQQEFLQIIQTNVVRLTHLINDILDVEKMESGKMQLAAERQDLNSVLKECRDTFSIVAAQKGIELHYRVPNHLPFVLGDRGRLVQVFMNLLSNAIKYTEQGVVELEAEADESAVTVRVRDSGLGMTEVETSLLFQKFYRTRSGLMSNEGGTGLGLVIVRNLVEAHGGTVQVESAAGQGTCFVVKLPVAPQLAEEASTRGPFESRAWQRPIWIIDSDPTAAKEVVRILEGAGALFNGHRLSLRVFKEVADVPELAPGGEAPFMVIVDGSVSALRKKVHKTLPILVVSSQVDAAEAFAQGASALLTKPIGEREFLIAVKELISAKGLRVLIADHNTDTRILLKRALEQKGFHVDDVERGRLVLNRLEQEDYDLALIDLGFTDVPANELLKAIRNESQFKSLPVFVMLDETRDMPTSENLAAWGAQVHVGKDQGIDGIVDAVSRYFEGRR